MKARQRKAILSNLARCMGVTMESILCREHNVELVDNRSMIVAILMEHARMRQQDVALLLKISQASVSKLLARHRLMMKHPGGNPDYQQRYAEFVMKALTPLPPLSPRRGGREATQRDNLLNDKPDQRPAGTPLHHGEGPGVRSEKH